MLSSKTKPIILFMIFICFSLVFPQDTSQTAKEKTDVWQEGVANKKTPEKSVKTKVDMVKAIEDSTEVSAKDQISKDKDENITIELIEEEEEDFLSADDKKNITEPKTPEDKKYNDMKLLEAELSKSNDAEAKNAQSLESDTNLSADPVLESPVEEKISSEDKIETITTIEEESDEPSIVTPVPEVKTVKKPVESAKPKEGNVSEKKKDAEAITKPKPTETVVEERAKTIQPDTISKPKTAKFGIGFNIGMRTHFPNDIENLTSDIWMYAIYKELEPRKSDKTISPGLYLKLKGDFTFTPRLCIEPFAQCTWAGKSFEIRGGMSKNFSLNMYHISGGLNLWLRTTPDKNYTFKLGVGGYAAYTYLDVYTSEDGNTLLTGTGYGGNGLLGFDINVKNIVINIGVIIPVGRSIFTGRVGDLACYDLADQYPEKYVHTGFEISPGITYHF